MSFFCSECAPENFEDYHVGLPIYGFCENDSCKNSSAPVDQQQVRKYVLRESCGGEE